MKKVGAQFIKEVLRPAFEDIFPFRSTTVLNYLERYSDEIWPAVDYFPGKQFSSKSDQGTSLTLTDKSTLDGSTTDLSARLQGIDNASLRLSVYQKQTLNENGGIGFGPRSSKGFVYWSDLGQSAGKFDDTTLWMRGGNSDTISASNTTEGGWVFSGSSSFTLNASLGPTRKSLYIDGFDRYTQEGFGSETANETNTATIKKFNFSDLSNDNPFAISFSGTTFADGDSLTTKINWNNIKVVTNNTEINTTSLSTTLDYYQINIGISLSDLMETEGGTAKLATSILPIIMLGDNLVSGSASKDVIDVGTGNDIVRAYAGDDNLYGGAGNDALYGGAGNDILSGGIGNDQIYGGDGNDCMEHVNDSFSPDNAPGKDTYYGGRGNDVYIIDELGAAIVERRGEGTDSVYTQLDNYTLADNVENLTHDRDWGTVDFTGRGNAIANVIESAAGNDSLFGLAGDDKLIGNDGNDFLNGGAGRDELRGGSGADQFVFDAALNSRTNSDTIVDFNRIQGDKLVLEDGFFSKLKGGITSDYVRVNSTGIAQDSNDYLIFNSTNGKLFYDADGSGRGATVEFATLTGVSTLSHDNFFII